MQTQCRSHLSKAEIHWQLAYLFNSINSKKTLKSNTVEMANVRNIY